MLSDDELRTCDYCGTPDAVAESRGYRCQICGKFWTIAERAEEEEEETDGP